MLPLEEELPPREEPMHTLLTIGALFVSTSMGLGIAAGSLLLVLLLGVKATTRA